MMFEIILRLVWSSFSRQMYNSYNKQNKATEWLNVMKAKYIPVKPSGTMHNLCVNDTITGDYEFNAQGAWTKIIAAAPNPGCIAVW